MDKQGTFLQLGVCWRFDDLLYLLCLHVHLQSIVAVKKPAASPAPWVLALILPHCESVICCCWGYSRLRVPEAGSQQRRRAVETAEQPASKIAQDYLLTTLLLLWLAAAVLFGPWLALSGACTGHYLPCSPCTDSHCQPQFATVLGLPVYLSHGFASSARKPYLTTKP